MIICDHCGLKKKNGQKYELSYSKGMGLIYDLCDKCSYLFDIAKHELEHQFLNVDFEDKERDHLERYKKRYDDHLEWVVKFKNI